MSRLLSLVLLLGVVLGCSRQAPSTLHTALLADPAPLTPPAVLEPEDTLPALPPLPDTTIPSLVAELSSDSFAIRQRATEQLLRLGPPALPWLEHELGRGPTLDFRLRAEHIIRTICRSVSGGERAADLQARLSSDRTTFRAGEPLELHLEIKNLGERPCEVASLLPSNMTVSGEDESMVFMRWVHIGSQTEIVVRRLDAPAVEPGEPVSHQVMLAGGGRELPPPRQSLQPHQTAKASIDIGELLPGPGDYEVHMLFRGADVLECSNQTLRSNKLQLQSSPPLRGGLSFPPRSGGLLSPFIKPAAGQRPR